MFFHKDLFVDHGIDMDTAIFLAKLCNGHVDDRATILTGNMYTDGSGNSFSTNRKETDTHALVALEIVSMGTLRPSESPVRIDRPTKEDRERMLSNRVKQLEREVQTERSKQHERP